MDIAILHKYSRNGLGGRAFACGKKGPRRACALPRANDPSVRG